MKRILVVLFLVACLVMSGQAVCFAQSELPAPADDPSLDMAASGPALNGDSASTPDLNVNPEGPLPLTAEEASAAVAKQVELNGSAAADAKSSRSLYTELSGTTEANWVGTKTDEADTRAALPLPGAWYGYVKLPFYNQGGSPYCGPFSAYQILRYMRCSETNLMMNLIREMYIPGQGSSVYRLARSLNKRLHFTYLATTIGTPVQYAYKHIVDIRDHKMPLDNLVRIYGGRLGQYKRYHSGHYIDSNGYHFNRAQGFAYLAITDTYDEALAGGGHTAGRHWVPFWQMYSAVSRHPLHKVVW